ncbi:MAG: GIY-YIG nuclease family protein [Candidatus Omnitrophica bacterium]|nr:GIY-YIG nuclease family protein [Candidatus Omnitrophota bacterium]
MFYTYALESLRDRKLYIGFTSDLKKRFSEHQAGKVISTRSRRPLRILFYEAFRSDVDAKRRERYFKTTKGKSSLRQMLRCCLEMS